VGSEGERIGMRTFGASAPLKELQKKFGFTVDAVAAAAREQVNQAKRSLKKWREPSPKRRFNPLTSSPLSS
jgi:hypothetical protein